jgi:hypothetical protein
MKQRLEDALERDLESNELLAGSLPTKTNDTSVPHVRCGKAAKSPVQTEDITDYEISYESKASSGNDVTGNLASMSWSNSCDENLGNNNLIATDDGEEPMVVEKDQSLFKI